LLMLMIVWLSPSLSLLLSLSFSLYYSFVASASSYFPAAHVYRSYFLFAMLQT